MIVVIVIVVVIVIIIIYRFLQFRYGDSCKSFTNDNSIDRYAVSIHHTHYYSDTCRVTHDTCIN